MTGPPPATTQACRECAAPLVAGARFCLACGVAVTKGATVGDFGPGAGRLSGGPGGSSPGEVERRNQLSQMLVEATLGEFEILGELGQGGMATVFLGHDLALDRKVAIKVIAPALLSAPGAVERFKRESRTAAALSHPHIIPVHSVRETQHLLYFVMKFVEGRPLDEIIRQQGALPIRMVQAILTEVGQALAYAHRRGVVHRDIKPANIMLDAEGWAVVTDFGIAKVMESDALTVSGAMVGTPHYMSPEQCSGKPVTGASDQYSLGVVAYEMLTGRPPFSGGTIMEIMKGHFFEAPAGVEGLRPDCPLPLAAAVARMLSKEPLERWPSMDEAVAATEASPLAQDDPVRGEMIALARSSESLRRISRLSIPVSPLPAAWTRARPLTTSNPTATAPPTLQGTIVEEGPAAPGNLLQVVLVVLLLMVAGAGAAYLLRPRPPAVLQAPPAATAPDPVHPTPAEPSTDGPTPPADSAAVAGTADTAAPAVLPTASPAPAPSTPPPRSATEVAAERRRDLEAFAIAVEGRLRSQWRLRSPSPEALDVEAEARLTYEVEFRDGAFYPTPETPDSKMLEDTYEVLQDPAAYGQLPPLLRRGSVRLRVTFTPQGGVAVHPEP